MFKIKFGLQTRLLLLCVFMSFIPILLGGFAYFGMKHLSNDYEKVTENILPNIAIADQMYLNFRQIRISLRSLGLPNIDQAQGLKFIEDVERNIKEYEDKDKQYINGSLLPDEKVLHAKVVKSWNEFKVIGEKVLTYYRSGSDSDRDRMLQIFLVDCLEAAKAYDIAMTDLVLFQRSEGREFVKEAKATYSQTSSIMITIICLGVLVGMSAGVVFAVSLSKTLAKVSKTLSDESAEVSQVSGQISQSAKALSTASSSQAASLEETVATIEELSSMVKLNSDHAKEAAELASSTRDVAIKGEAEIMTLIDSIQSISADSKKIAEITSVIDDIAFQTNLLALNAAVEAARAGEQGRGFAVVADAVRSLSQRSAQSAKGIAELIQASVQKISIGSEQASRSGVVLSEIVNSIKKVADLNGEISLASQQQAQGIEQIGKAMNQLDQVTQENASSAEESALSATKLTTQSEALGESLLVLEEIVLGETNTRAVTKNVTSTFSAA